MSVPKPFQDAAVDAAMAAFANEGGRRRFLVADEVGLGKTVVAKEVARRMSDDGTRPLIIYYIANGHAVSHQNKTRVVDFLEKEARKKAIKTPDRLSLIAMSRPPEGTHIYALTPGTSFPGTRARLTGGKKEERAFLKVLLARAYPAFLRELEQRDPNALKLKVGECWGWLVEHAEARFGAAAPNLTQRFRDTLAEEFGAPVRPALELAAFGDPARKIAKLTSGAFVGKLRRALALATLRQQPPDLVVFDEFQRYRHMLDDTDADPLLRALLDPPQSGRKPAILLLSATPYRLLSSRWEESQGALAHTELLNLVDFLAGPQARARAKTLFSDFGDKLRDIASHVDVSHPDMDRDVKEATELRDQLRTLLTPVMSRTERDSVASSDQQASTTYLDASPRPEDFSIYRHLVDSFAETDSHDALPYWASVPLPAQALGPRYTAWRRASIRSERGLPQMTRARRDRLDEPDSWPDAKLRSLGRIASPERLALPWVAPSLPWWPLGGKWKDAATAVPGAAEADPKLLLFSRFRATPGSIAALLSFGVEAQCLRGRRGGYEKAYKRRRFKLAAVPGPVMAAFHPSPWLIRTIDPLAKPGTTIAAVRKEVRRQILAALPPRILVQKTAHDKRRHRSIAHTIAAIEQWSGLATQSGKAWLGAIGDDRAAMAAVKAWRETPAIDTLSRKELADLVDYAIGGPGVALGRALFRHDPSILDAARFDELVTLSWQGLRTYFDNPVILAALPEGHAVDQILKAVVDGGLESVLDEHFWFRAQSLPDGPSELASDLAESIGLRAGSFSFHGIGGAKQRIPIRCHVAVPFGDAEAEPKSKTSNSDDPAAPARPDEVRRSFNTPFWPHVLATTSVGQEGLDFHPWCARVVHWDLSSNPLDLEQREGRVQRYAGLAVRRHLARLLSAEVLAADAGEGSPWIRLEEQAKRFVDTSGLKPWWVLDGAQIKRHVFRRPFGRDTARFARLREQRMIYRLALGQPNQEDFVELLSRGGEAIRDVLRPLVLDLSALGLRK